MSTALNLRSLDVRPHAEIATPAAAPANDAASRVPATVADALRTDIARLEIEFARANHAAAAIAVSLELARLDASREQDRAWDAYKAVRDSGPDHADRDDTTWRAWDRAALRSELLLERRTLAYNALTDAQRARYFDLLCEAREQRAQLAADAARGER